ncbi:MAG: ATP-binding cassette domain-containing protein [Oscillospiraceae bacterium]|nr:ATP-binding cassette domain-containing protein [Oscillospiraceae bacterium]
MTKTPDSIKNTTSAADSQASDPHGAGRPIRLTGVRVHNLKNFSLSIPRNKVVAIAGPSGSGKSSLAFDTIFAEGQRQ